MIPKRQFRVLNQAEAGGLRRSGLDPRTAFKLKLVFPVGGGEEFDPDSASEDDLKAKASELEIEGADKLSGDDLKKAIKDKMEASDEDEDEDDEDDEDDDIVKMPKSEAERIKRENKEMRDAEKKRKREEDKAKRKRQADEGKFEEMAREAEEEKNTAIKERDEARDELADYKGRQTVQAVAERLNYEYPSDARLYLTDEEFALAKDEDEAGIERALKRVLRERPKLKGAEQPTGGGHQNGGGGKKGDLSWDKIRKMSPDEMSKRQKEVDEFIERNPETVSA